MRHTATDNLATVCLIAIARVLAWATDDPVANPHTAYWRIHQPPGPICIRYDIEYAAMIATGVWKAKKHKDAAPLAQRAWKRLKARKGERLCIQHAGRGHPRDGHWVQAARGLALLGKCGTYIYAADVG